tara:strand:+ start:3419 stop:3754 length:336 start_codon:yes stop_codon:yes gene_type:complete
MNKNQQKYIPEIVKEFTNLFDHPLDAEKFLDKLKDSKFQTAIRYYASYYNSHEGAVIEMINKLTIDSIESKMLCKEYKDKQDAQRLNEDINLDKIMAHAMPGYKTWENNNG